MAWTLLQYGTRVDDMLSEIGVAAQVRVIRALRRLQVEGNGLRFPKTRSLGDGLFELRTDCGAETFRHIFIFRGPIIVIVEAFRKKTQKTPLRNMERAKDARDKYDAGEAALGNVTFH